MGDACDNCPLLPNDDQADRDDDGFGNVCDLCVFTATERNQDSDSDGFGDRCDNCPTVANFDQGDRDQDGIGDLCDPEDDEARGCTHTGSALPARFALLALLVAASFARGRG